MRKLPIVLWCILAACGVVLSAFSVKRQAENPAMPQLMAERITLPEPTAANPAAAPGEAEAEAPDGGGYYVLKSYMYRLAVYRVYPDGTQTLADIIDMDVRALPVQDQMSLQEGIVVRSNDALLRILEDFMS